MDFGDPLHLPAVGTGDESPAIALEDLPDRRALLAHVEDALADEHWAAARPAVLALALLPPAGRTPSADPRFLDRVRAELAARILRTVPPGSRLARIDADGFAVLLLDRRDVPEMGERLLAALRRPCVVDDRAVTMRVAIGTAGAPQDGQDAAALLQSALVAQQRASDDGGDRVQACAPHLRAPDHERASLAEALARALAPTAAGHASSFVLHFQPQVLGDGRLVGFEALVRWQHPTRGMVEPDLFIALAEHAGLIEPLGRWVLDTACRIAAGWPAPLSVAVNLSPLQVRNRRTVLDDVQAALRRTGLRPERLVLEVSERSLGSSETAATLHALKALGVKLALDDFGTSVGSLTLLAEHPFDCLKIDRSFVHRLTERDDDADGAQARWMLDAIASLGSGLNLSIVAEGVETEDQRRMVAAAGVAVTQGFLTGRPMPAHEAARLIAAAPR